MLEIGSFYRNDIEILSKVGAGGMSDVYKAKDHIAEPFCSDKGFESRSFREDSSVCTQSSGC